MDTTVVIPCINSEDVIEDCIKSLDCISVPIIIVNNGCVDKTIIKIKKLEHNITILDSKKNLGWGNAANLGISKVKTKYTLLLNQDIKIISKNPIDLFEEHMKKYENIGMSSCVTLNENFEKESGRTTFFSSFNSKILKYKNDLPSGDTCSLLNCVYGGAIIFFDTKKFQLVGGFDPNCFLYLEEDDLCFRMKKKNFLNIIFPSIQAVHLGSKSSKIPNLTWWKNWHWAWSELYFKKKYNFKNIKVLSMFRLIKFLFKTIIYYSNKNNKYYLYSGRLHGTISFLLGKKAMEFTPSPSYNNAKGIFGKIENNKNENYTLSK